MRTKRRYILVRVEPEYLPISPRDLYYSLLEAITTIFGDSGAAKVQPAVLSCTGGVAIVRCVRNTEAMVFSSLPTVTRVAEHRVALRSCATGGTLLSLRRRLGESPRTPAEIGDDVEFDGNSYQTVRYHGEKVDLIEKGFKSQTLLFLTQQDLEE
jgi:ribonuclease P/MRP protein subunit POP5